MQSAISNKVFIGLGSNEGDCEANLRAGIRLIEEHLTVTTIASSLYRSEPVERLDQPWFVNQVVSFKVSDGLQPTMVLHLLKKIERLIGRVPGVRYGPRVIDLDLLFFRDWVFECGTLTIPHPKIEQRSFVLLPLIEMNPGLVHPRTQNNLQELLENDRAQFSQCEKISGH